MRITEQLAAYVQRALADAESSGSLPAAGAVEIVIDKSRGDDNGDFSTNVALRLARAMQIAPLDIAEKIAEALGEAAEIERAWAAPPGFGRLPGRMPRILKGSTGLARPYG